MNKRAKLNTVLSIYSIFNSEKGKFAFFLTKTFEIIKY